MMSLRFGLTLNNKELGIKNEKFLIDSVHSA